MGVLMNHDFPGNIRELENIIEHGFVLCHGSIIKREHLPPELLQTENLDEIPAKSNTSPVAEKLNEESRILDALKNSGGVLSKAAEKLGMHRTTLWRKIKRYNIDLSQF
jgi:transcriptional regulator of acetoin/glycerol metabolism